MKHLATTFELFVPRCTLTYGVPPCSADGDEPCFNTPGTCQAPQDFAPVDVPIRFVTNSELVPDSQSIPNLLSVDVSPQVIKPGESLGKRERATISLKDHPHNDANFDPYPDSRDYNPWERGTFWGKFLARYPNPVGYPCRVYRVERNLAGPIADGLSASSYVVDKVERAQGGFQFSVLDALTFTDDRKALCPRPNNGLLGADIGTAATSFTLTPAGIGDTYPAEGYATIGGREFVSYTRSGDTVTLTARALRESELREHREGDTFQAAAHLVGNVALILEQLLGYTSTPANYYNVAQWQEEADTYASEILEAFIATPTGVGTLTNHLMVEMALDIHTDLQAEKIIMRVLRPLPPIADYSADNLKSITPSLDNDSRIDTVFFRYGRINPTEKFNEPKNYRANLLRLDDNPQAAIQQNTSRIKEIYSIFIPATLRQTARDTSALIIGRYNRLAREVRAVTTPELSVPVGSIVSLTSDFFQDATGATSEAIPMQVVSRRIKDGEHELTLQEYSFGDFEFLGGNTVTIPVNMTDVNLRALYNTTYGSAPIPAGTEVVFEGLNDEIVLGGTTFALAEDWPEIADGVTITLRRLEIFGRGGAGAGTNSLNGGAGQTALYTRVPLTIIESTIAGGGGGGGRRYENLPTFPGFQIWGGGGGAGVPGGLAGSSSTYVGGGSTPAPGTKYAGGNPSPEPGGAGGSNGNAGQERAGQNGETSLGGPGGLAIDGDSYVTHVSTTIIGGVAN